ncbi:MAG: nicotinate-nucleotide--dimethylbenzimidazole phosphoribosyltransferase [Desulfobacteraceae bacterium]|nr:MAG: nicotinate-nucleotide--dimethylbenzimidazole phosphoribosyltransferase [Desulfobacteraceae bacterium]
MTAYENKLETIARDIQPLDPIWLAKARERTAQLLMPTRALGRLHDISEQICAIQKTLQPSLDRKAFVVMAGDHGVTAEGVSAYPQEVTGSMVRTFLAGGAGINVLAAQIQADMIVVDMGVISDLSFPELETENRLFIHKIARGTFNLAQGPAMTREQAAQSVYTGFQIATRLFEKGVHILGTGDMGIGNTTPAAAIGVVLCNSSPEAMTGRGAGVDDAGLIRKIKAVQNGLNINRPDPRDGLDVLSKVGGFEIGGIAGLVLAGAFHQRPVVIDGFISTAGALIANSLSPGVRPYLLAGHCSKEPGHGLMLKHLGLASILDLGMGLGEGAGGALAMNIIEGALRIFKNMLTFEQAGVANKE